MASYKTNVFFSPDEVAKVQAANTQKIAFDPTAERRAKTRQAMAERLLKRGEKDLGTEVITGMAVKRSPLEFLAKELSSFQGKDELRRADQDLANVDASRGNLYADALSKMGENPAEAYAILAQDPQAQPAALKMYADLLSDERQLQAAQELARFRSSVPSSLPASIALANAIQDAIASGDHARANLLRQSAKLDDKGIDYYGGGMMPTPGLVPPQAQMNMQQMVAAQGFNPAQVDAEMNNAVRSTPGADPLDGYIATAPNAPQRPAPLQAGDVLTVPPAMSQGGGAQVAPGYAGALANIAATKKAAEGRASEVGKRAGENENLYRSMVSRMPQLNSTVERLSKLGQIATYTVPGLIKDTATRELGMDISDAAQARAAYISTVSNEILPLLRDTFGAQFTEREGERLLATLGDPNVSPPEKDAVLRSFIESKTQTINSLQREISYGDALPQYNAAPVAIGGEQFNPGGTQQEGVASIVEKLRASGRFSDADIQEYLKAKGLQ